MATEEQTTTETAPKLDIQGIGTTFIRTYYEQFRSDRTKLEAFYRDPSCLSFEGQGFQGTRKIMNKLRVKRDRQ